MRTSKHVERWKEEARIESEAKGITGSLVKILSERFGVLPEDLQSGIARQDTTTLDDWLTEAMYADSLDDFPQSPQI